MIVFQHTPALALIILAVLAVLAIGLYSARRYLPINLPNIGLCALFLLSLTLLFWCLLLPGLRDARTELIKPRFVIALDTSASMTVAPGEEVEDRWVRAQEALSLPWLEHLSAEVDIELYTFDSELSRRRALEERHALEPDGRATLLRDTLRELTGRYTGLNVVGGLLLSDGHDTREQHDDWSTDSLPFPIHTVRLEDDAEWEQEPNLRVVSVSTPRRVNRGWESTLRAVISGEGTGGQTVNVHLFRDDEQVDETPTQIPDMGGDRQVSFTLQHDEVGIYTYRVYVPPLPGETQLADNEYKVIVSVADPRDRLLYVEGVPRFEYRFLRRTLLAEERIVPAIFFSGADGAPISGTPDAGASANMTESDLLEFKIVILGNLDAEELTEARAANLVRFVEDGGSLVLLGGSRGWGPAGFAETPLDALLPVRAHGTEPLEADDTPFPVEIEPEALAHPAFAGDADLWDVVPPVLSVFPDVEPRPGAEILVSAVTPQGRQPIIVTQRYGDGRVAALFTDSLWRWRMDPAAAERETYARFWSQLLAWMIPEEDEDERRRIDLFADDDHVYRGDTLKLSARYIDAEMHDTRGPIEVHITLPDGREVPYSMEEQDVITDRGRSYPGYFLEFSPEEAGHHTAVAQSPDEPDAMTSDPISFNVRPYSPETIPHPIHIDVLRNIAFASGGTFFNDLEQLDEELANLRVSIIEEERSEFHSLWRRWLLLVALMGLFVLTWLLRKLQHMP